MTTNTALSNYGHIYIASNPYYKSSLYKIGKSENIDERLTSLCNSTFFPGEFVLEYKVETEYVREVEQFLFATLHNYRLGHSEFFDVPLTMAINAIEEAVDKINNNHNLLDEMFSNNLQEWNNELAKLAVETYTRSKCFVQVGVQVKKLPITVEAFLNYIGAASTYDNPKNSIYPGFPRDCYRNNTFEQLINA